MGNAVFLSAMFPFYGLLAGNLKDVAWMTLANIAIQAVVIFCVLLVRKEKNKRFLMKTTMPRAFLGSLMADGAALVFRFLPLLTEMLLRLLGAKEAAKWLGKFLSDYTWYQIWNNRAIGLSWTVASILVGGIAAFCIQYFWLLKRGVPEKKLRLALAVWLAVFSAPYSWTNPMW